VFVTLDELDSGGDVNVSGVEAGWVVMESNEDGSRRGGSCRACMKTS